MSDRSFPAAGRPAADVLADLADKQAGDARWAEGRTFGLVFDGGDDVRAVADEAARLYLHESALNTSAFPSLGAIQSELCGWIAGLFHGPEAAGFLTSGGTESILLAVKAARERALAERGVTEPEIVLAESAHAAFHKGAHLFGLTVRSTPVTDDLTADVGAMAAEVGPDTALVVASAMDYPTGLVDPVPEIAALAASVGASCHVDACMGGFVLPFAEMEGRPAPIWDFRSAGVTTISADIHKLGYAPKGVSVLLHASRELRRHQTFVFENWLGGLYATPNLQGTRAGLPMAAAWAVVSHLGAEGYRRLVRDTLDAADRIRAGVRAIDGLALRGDPVHQILTFRSDDAGLDVFAVGDALAARGWHIDRQYPPDCLHLTVSNGNVPVVDEFLGDLAACADEARSAAPGGSSQYATID
jgi:glutamate/tyrosine decarboxylase-like PLP-dependent enzyme